jgi:hypothetical protein
LWVGRLGLGLGWWDEAVGGVMRGWGGWVWFGSESSVESGSRARLWGRLCAWRWTRLWLL